MLRYKIIRKEIFIVRNRITLQAAILDCSEAAVDSHPFSKISPGNTGGRVFLLVKLQTDCSESRLYTKMTPPTSEATVHSHTFSIISRGNTSGRILLLVKLQTDCSEWQLYTKMTPPRMFSWKSSAWTVQKQLSTAIHFRKFLQKLPVVESFFWSNCRLTVQSSDYILK